MSLFGSLNTASQPQQSGGLFGSLNQPQQQNQQQQSGGLFGSLGQSSSQQPQPQSNGPSLFGAQNQQPQQQNGGFFGSLGQSAQQPQQQQQSGGLFGGLGQNNQQQQQQQQSGGLFGGLGQNNQQQQQQQQQQQGSSLFGGLGQSNQPNQQSQQGGLFGGGLGANNQQNQQSQPGQLSFGNSQIWQVESQPHQKSVPEEIATVLGKWDTGSPNCMFRHYFYNKVDEQKAPYYRPGPNEDPKAWEEALSKKPGPGYIPVLCVGFTQMGERIKTQQRNLATFNQKLHEINSSLEAMLNRHDMVISVRALDAKRRHTVLKQRCLRLAAKAQVLRNRGYALGGDEEDLKAKLLALERGVCDPGLSARAEEIWARMVGVRERARLLKDEIGKRAAMSEGLNEEAVRRSEKLLELYGQQLAHLKKEMNLMQQEYKEWEKEQGSQPKAQ